MDKDEPDAPNADAFDSRYGSRVPVSGSLIALVKQVDRALCANAVFTILSASVSVDRRMLASDPHQHLPSDQKKGADLIADAALMRIA